MGDDMAGIKPDACLWKCVIDKTDLRTTLSLAFSDVYRQHVGGELESKIETHTMGWPKRERHVHFSLFRIAYESVVEGGHTTPHAFGGPPAYSADVRGHAEVVEWLSMWCRSVSSSESSVDQESFVRFEARLYSALVPNSSQRIAEQVARSDWVSEIECQSENEKQRQNQTPTTPNSSHNNSSRRRGSINHAKSARGVQGKVMGVDLFYSVVLDWAWCWAGATHQNVVDFLSTFYAKVCHTTESARTSAGSGRSAQAEGEEVKTKHGEKEAVKEGERKAEQKEANGQKSKTKKLHESINVPIPAPASMNEPLTLVDSVGEASRSSVREPIMIPRPVSTGSTSSAGDEQIGGKEGQERNDVRNDANNDNTSPQSNAQETFELTTNQTSANSHNISKSQSTRAARPRLGAVQPNVLPTPTRRSGGAAGLAGRADGVRGVSGIGEPTPWWAAMDPEWIQTYHSLTQPQTSSDVSRTTGVPPGIRAQHPGPRAPAITIASHASPARSVGGRTTAPLMVGHGDMSDLYRDDTLVRLLKYSKTTPTNVMVAARPLLNARKEAAAASAASSWNGGTSTPHKHSIGRIVAQYSQNPRSPSPPPVSSSPVVVSQSLPSSSHGRASSPSGRLGEGGEVRIDLSAHPRSLPASPITLRMNVNFMRSPSPAASPWAAGLKTT